MKQYIYNTTKKLISNSRYQIIDIRYLINPKQQKQDTKQIPKAKTPNSK